MILPRNMNDINFKRNRILIGFSLNVSECSELLKVMEAFWSIILTFAIMEMNADIKNFRSVIWHSKTMNIMLNYQPFTVAAYRYTLR